MKVSYSYTDKKDIYGPNLGEDKARKIFKFILDNSDIIVDIISLLKEIIN